MPRWSNFGCRPQEKTFLLKRFREDQKDEIPRPTSTLDVALEEGSFVQAVVAVMSPVRRAWSRGVKAVKKTLTIPAWMEEELRKREDVKVSLILQEALQKMKIREPVSF